MRKTILNRKNSYREDFLQIAAGNLQTDLSTNGKYFRGQV
jgi:hypothetical protein